MRIKPFLVLPLLLMVACNQGQITQALSLAISAAEIAIPIIGQATGTDQAVLAAAANYLRDANEALSTVTTILGSADPDPVKAAKITAALSGVVKADLPAGTPQTIANAVNQVALAVGNLLTHFPAPGSRVMAPEIKLTAADRAALEKARVKIAANRAALAKLPK